MQATDSRSYDMSIGNARTSVTCATSFFVLVQEEEENEQRGLFSPPIIERVERLLGALDLLLLIFWHFKLFPVLAGAICFFHVIVRFKIDRFDQFDHSDAPDPIGFSAHLMSESIRGSTESKTKFFSSFD